MTHRHSITVPLFFGNDCDIVLDSSKPYVQSYLLLQGGKFDHADRLFNSIERAWLSASRDNTTDVRELTPEFYYLPEFLVNENNFEFGKLQNGESSHDVELPPWAKVIPKYLLPK